MDMNIKIPEGFVVVPMLNAAIHISVLRRLTDDPERFIQFITLIEKGYFKNDLAEHGHGLEVILPGMTDIERAEQTEAMTEAMDKIMELFERNLECGDWPRGLPGPVYGISKKKGCYELRD